MKRIETERLILDKWTTSREDVEGLYGYARDPEVGPNAGWKPHESAEESREIIEELFIPHDVWAIREKETGKVVGSIGLEPDRRRENVNSREMGYSLAKESWGKGYMTEAVNVLRGWAFANRDVIMVLAHPAKEDIIFHGLLRKSGFGHWTEHEHSPSEDVEVWCSEKKPTYYVKIGLLLGLGIGVVVGSIFGISRWITALVGGLIGILCCTAIDVKNSRKRYEILKQEQERT